jgi:hypothetical protein
MSGNGLEHPTFVHAKRKSKFEDQVDEVVRGTEGVRSKLKAHVNPRELKQCMVEPFLMQVVESPLNPRTLPQGLPTAS